MSFYLDFIINYLGNGFSVVFVRHEGRKDRGISSACRMIKCYKCGREIEMGELFYSKSSHSKGGCKTTGYICDPCYQSLYIDI